VDVFNLASDPYAYKETSRSVGSRPGAGKKMFHIVDYREYRACRIVDWLARVVTVLYNGKLPRGRMSSRSPAASRRTRRERVDTSSAPRRSG
jgi:hypothetical protein